MNTGMDLTFDLLATTRNEAAVGVLATSLEAADPQIRCRGLDSLLRRRSHRGAMHVLGLWKNLSDAELQTVQEHPAAMQPVVAEVLADSAEHPLWSAAIDALRMLNLTELLPPLIDRAEASGDRQIREPLLAATIELCSTLGTTARRGREAAGRRLPVLRRLAESVRRFEFHRCEELCVAFLAVSRWSDCELSTLLGDGSRTARWLAPPLTHSALPAVIQLLAGYVCRREIPETVRGPLRSRCDESFREQLLQCVTATPAVTTLRNLRALGPLACLADWQTVAGRTRPVHHAALVHALSATCADPLRRLAVTLDVLVQANREADSAVAQSLLQSPRLEEEALLRGLTTAAGMDTVPDRSDPLARLVWRVLQVLDHPNPAVAEGLRSVLWPLHLERFLERVEGFRVFPPAELGELIHRINPSAVERVADELRHPVLARRLRAIDAVRVCGFFDSLDPLLLSIAQHDHREAQLRAVDALGAATSQASLELLQRLGQGPEGGLRDAARQALEQRALEQRTLEQRDAAARELAPRAGSTGGS